MRNLSVYERVESGIGNGGKREWVVFDMDGGKVLGVVVATLTEIESLLELSSCTLAA